MLKVNRACPDDDCLSNEKINDPVIYRSDLITQNNNIKSNLKEG